MANVDVVNLNGEKVGSIELADAVYGQIKRAHLFPIQIDYIHVCHRLLPWELLAISFELLAFPIQR